MASTQIALPENTWVQITTTDKDGSINHQSGNGVIIYLESPTEPASLSTSTPVMERTWKGNSWNYYKVLPTDFVWAFSVDADSVITVSPAEV